MRSVAYTVDFDGASELSTGICGRESEQQLGIELQHIAERSGRVEQRLA